MLHFINLVVFDADDTLWYGADGGYIAGIDYHDKGSDSYTFRAIDQYTIQRDDGQRFCLYFEVPNVLSELHQRGILISLASYNHSGTALRALQTFGIDLFFKHMVIEFHSQKDRMLLNILQGFCEDGFYVTPSSTLFIDDDRKGSYRHQMARIGVNFLQRGTDIQNLTEILDHPDFILQPIITNLSPDQQDRG